MSIRSKVKKARRFVSLTTSEKAYLAMLRAHHGVDAAHYRAVHTRLPLLFRALPTRHYVVFGEQIGLSPRPDFVPHSYRRLNPDVEKDAAAQPLAHFLRTGRAQGLHAVEQLRPNSFPPLLRQHPPSAAHAIVLHLYYLDLWPEFAAVLRTIDLDFDLFVSLTEQSNAETVAAHIRSAFPQSVVLVLPNHGRDVWPFMYLVGSGLLDDYEAVCKIHGKRSAHRADGTSWRTGLVASLLPTQGTGELIRRFLADPQAMVLASPGSVRRDRRAWGRNRGRVNELLMALGVAAPRRLAPFPAGSMFWAKPPVVQWLKALGLGAGDFETEYGQLDATTAHAIERLIGIAARAHPGGTVKTVDELRS